MLLQELTELFGGEKNQSEIVAHIGKEFGVDFNDADGSNARTAILAAYKQGWKDGIYWHDRNKKR